MPLAGAPHDLMECSCLLGILCKVFCNSLLFACHFCALVFPIPPSLRLVLVSKYSTELFSVTVPGGGRLQGCHGYFLFLLEHCPAPQSL